MLPKGASAWAANPVSSIAVGLTTDPTVQSEKLVTLWRTTVEVVLLEAAQS
jgi:hypothetical protein